MSKGELVKKAEEYFKELGKKRIPFTIENVEREIRNAFVAGEKELQKENKRLTKRICELQSDLSKVKSLNEKMRRCSNCVHRFVRHFSQEGTCQRPNCKNYSDWCFDGQFTEIEK